MRESSELESAMLVLRGRQEIAERDFFTRWVSNTSHGKIG